MEAAMKNSRESDVHVTFEDQQKINKFARHNVKFLDLNEEVAAKQKELQNLTDAGEELMLQDDDIMVPYQVGEVFVSLSTEETNAMLDKNKDMLQTEIKSLEAECAIHKEMLSDLKVQLYAKFGTNINLEADDET